MQSNEQLLRGTLSTIILYLLSKHDKMYGYEMTKRVQEQSEEKILLKEGSLYPALHKLEADGLIVAHDVVVGKRIRRYYMLSTKGKQESILQIQNLLGFLDTLQRMLTPLNPELHAV